MRPDILSPLFASVRSLGGVGPRLEATFARLLGISDSEDGPRVIDLLFHLPIGLVDRRSRPVIAEAEAGALATLEVTVGKHRPSPRGPQTPALQSYLP